MYYLACLNRYAVGTNDLWEDAHLFHNKDRKTQNQAQTHHSKYEYTFCVYPTTVSYSD